MWPFLNYGSRGDMESTLSYISLMGYDHTKSEEDLSTGYLEDALVEYGGQLKRRRSILYGTGGAEELAFEGCWNSNCSWEWDPVGNFNWNNHVCLSDSVISGLSDSRSQSSAEELNLFSEIQTPVAAHSSLLGLEEILECSSSIKDSSKKTNACSKTKSDHKVSIDLSIDTATYKSDLSGERMRKKRVIKRLVYPFALVKPGGSEGDVTLNDINERILMRPTRPVRHPVGNFACRPTCVSPHGPGLSGKAVVALTKIHTRGRGTITIIRTKG